MGIDIKNKEMWTKLKRGEIINVQGYKHNGTLYRQWNGAKVLEISEENVVLFLFKTKVTEKSGQRWVVREPILWWFPLEKWHNTTGLIRATGTYFYTNLASPPYYEDNTIKFVDYDLDVKAYPGQLIKIVDRKEFETHSKKMKYPEKLINKIDKEVQNVIELIAEGDDCFDEEVIQQWIEELVDNKLLGQKFAKKLMQQ